MQVSLFTNLNFSGKTTKEDGAGTVAMRGLAVRDANGKLRRACSLEFLNFEVHFQAVEGFGQGQSSEP